LDPKRHSGDGERHADLRLTIRRKCPIEAGAHIVEVPAVDGQPLGWREQLAIGFGARERATIVFGMATGDLQKFAGAFELFATVYAGGIEQTVAREVAAKIGDDQRFGDEVPNVLDDLGWRNIGCHRNRGFQREITSEHR
jgi:hypothetical protein